MHLEKEVTVKVNSGYEELHNLLLDKGFKIVDEYDVIDEYMIDKTIDINKMDKLEVLKKCILIREIIGIKKILLYKYKKFNDNGDILEQGKVDCPVTDIDKAIKFMEAINYRHLFKINDKNIVYANDTTELAVQLVNDKYIFIEIEDEPEFINRKYETIEEMKEDLDKYNLPYERDNYFVKKAEIMLAEIIDNNNVK